MYFTTYLYFICTDVTIAIIILLWVAPDFRITFENMQIFSKLLNMLNGRKFEPRHEKHNSVVSEQVRHKPSCTSTGEG